jgi:methylase of polypeptide subunit release factors
LADLISIGVFSEDENESISSPMVLFPYHGYLIFFERIKDGKDISVYMGDDSIALASHLTPPPGGHCLDLCTGALVCSSHSKEIIAVDLQKRAVEVATINTYLNMLEDRVSIRKPSRSLKSNSTLSFLTVAKN